MPGYLLGPQVLKPRITPETNPPCTASPLCVSYPCALCVVRHLPGYILGPEAKPAVSAASSLCGTYLRPFCAGLTRCRLRALVTGVHMCCPLHNGGAYVLPVTGAYVLHPCCCAPGPNEGNAPRRMEGRDDEVWRRGGVTHVWRGSPLDYGMLSLASYFQQSELQRVIPLLFPTHHGMRPPVVVPFMRPPEAACGMPL